MHACSFPALAGKRAINAELPVAGPPDVGQAEVQPGPKGAAPAQKPSAPAPKPPPRPKRRRRPIPAALKAIAGLIVIAIVFLVAAVLGGGGSNEQGQEPTPAPVQAPPQPEPEAQTPAAEAAEELGYPSFATNNTTRVGGSDAASTAAGISLAVFPSVKVGQRPAAVTIVEEDDWQGAVAAAVLMAMPLRAPLLVSIDGELPEATEQALAALSPQGTNEGGGAQVFAVGDAAQPDGFKTTQARGQGVQLAAALLNLRDELFRNRPEHIVLTSAAKSEFAVPAAAWAARSGDPVLFTTPGKLPKATIEQLKRHAKTPVYVLGPSDAVSSGVVREVAKLGHQVRRVSGEDAVENALALARYADGNFGWNVNDPGHGLVVARSDEPLLAAVAAPLSASGTWGPLLLTDDAATLPGPLREFLLDIKPGYTTDPTRAFYNHVWVIGDQEAIDVNQQAEIDQLAELTKIGGGEP